MAITKLTEGATLQVGKHNVVIGKYLSEGGFAQIYQVTIDQTALCLKRVIVPDKNGLNQLRKEVEVMKTLRNAKSIVKYYDSHAEKYENSYQVLVLMELCPTSLLDYMNLKIKVKLTEGEILKIMLDISQGVYEMHKLKLIHRDIKIENVLIDANHHYKLCDFGSTTGIIMPPLDQQQFAQLSNDILYQTTPQYRSPEMVDLYKGYPIDEKADIWALGCFLYKLCYYITPFETQGDIAILHASFQFPNQPIYSGDLKNLIIIMLQENPYYRPNIIQVIQLVCKLMNFEMKVNDFYKQGSYKFQALHEYQVQKQNEIIRQKQLYAQQMNHQVEEEPDNSSKESLTGFSSEGELEDAEQRYPSLENIDNFQVSRNPSMKSEKELEVDFVDDIEKLKIENLMENKSQDKESAQKVETSIPEVAFGKSDQESKPMKRSQSSTNFTQPSTQPLNSKAKLVTEPVTTPVTNLKSNSKPVSNSISNSLPDSIPNSIPTTIPNSIPNSISNSIPNAPPNSISKNNHKAAVQESIQKPVQQAPLIDSHFQHQQPYKVPETKYTEQRPEISEPINHNPWGEYKNESNLIDLETKEKPAYKKRLSYQNPINLQEEVIDFESDDENNNSNLNRIKIRNSLKKSRKS